MAQKPQDKSSYSTLVPPVGTPRDPGNASEDFGAEADKFAQAVAGTPDQRERPSGVKRKSGEKYEPRKPKKHPQPTWREVFNKMQPVIGFFSGNGECPPGDVVYHLFQMMGTTGRYRDGGDLVVDANMEAVQWWLDKLDSPAPPDIVIVTEGGAVGPDPMYQLPPYMELVDMAAGRTVMRPIAFDPMKRESFLDLRPLTNQAIDQAVTR